MLNQTVRLFKWVTWKIDQKVGPTPAEPTARIHEVDGLIIAPKNVNHTICMQCIKPLQELSTNFQPIHFPALLLSLYYSLFSHFPSPSLQRKAMETLIPEISKLLNDTLSPEQSIVVSATESLDRLSSQLPAFPLCLIAIASGIHPFTSIYLLLSLDFVSIPLYSRFLNLYSLLDLKRFSIVFSMLCFCVFSVDDYD